MKKLTVIATCCLTLTFALSACKKSQPSTKIDGTYKGHFEGVYMGNDTIVNTNFQVLVERIDKSSATVTGNLFHSFEVLVAKNGINVELVSPTDGLESFLFEGETNTLSFSYSHDGDTAIYVGTKND